jgi:hypothetical protein
MMEGFKDKRKECGVSVTEIGDLCDLNTESLLLRSDALRCQRIEDSCNRGK